MSQHILNTVCRDLPAQIVMGWDRRLQYYFLTVESLDDDADEDDGTSNGFLYSNLDDDVVPAVEEQIAYFETRLTRLGITVPGTMLENLRVDRIVDRGNSQVVYQPDGTFRDLG